VLFCVAVHVGYSMIHAVADEHAKCNRDQADSQWVEMDEA
jgi:hypothetical protein